MGCATYEHTYLFIHVAARTTLVHIVNVDVCAVLPAWFMPQDSCGCPVTYEWVVPRMNIHICLYTSLRQLHFPLRRCANYTCTYRMHITYRMPMDYVTYEYIYVCMGWLRLVGSLKLYVSFAKYSLFYRALLQKRPVILRSLLIVATPYLFTEIVFLRQLRFYISYIIVYVSCHV